MLRSSSIASAGCKYLLQQVLQKPSSVLSETNTTGPLRLPLQQACARWYAADAKQQTPEATLDPREDVMLQNSESAIAAHPGLKKESLAQCYLLSTPSYTKEYVESVRPSHKPIQGLPYRIGFTAVSIMRGSFDLATGYGHGKMTEAKWLQRIIFLETVAGVPGMVAGMLRHMRSLRSMKRDHGWIHTLLEESENERMHLLTFLQLREPSVLFRTTVLLSQGIFFNMFLLAYLVSPKICHAFVGYLEEEAVKTYTHLLEEIDAGKIWKDKPAPQLAIDYWKLGEGAVMRDVVLAVRADEACHAHVNHTFSDLKQTDTNPFVPGAGGKSDVHGTR